LPRPDGSRECITIAIRPTADDREGTLVVPSGLWRIKIENTTEQELGIDLRVHRDDVGMFARTGARQSYFDDPEYERFEPDSGRPINDEQRDGRQRMRVTRQGTLSTYAYAEGVVAVGGYRNSDGEPAAYSSSGSDGGPAVYSSSGSDGGPAVYSSFGGHAKRGHPKPRTKAAGPNRVSGLGKAVNPLYGPDLAAVSEESPALGGVLAAGTYSGSVAILNGTSVAAPQVTRALADEIAAGGSVQRLKTRVAASTPTKTNRPLRDGSHRLPFSSSYPKRR
jgi:hypothetical protein